MGFRSPCGSGIAEVYGLHFPESVTIDHGNDLLLFLCNVGDFQRASHLFNPMTSVDHKLDNYYQRREMGWLRKSHPLMNTLIRIQH